MSTRPKRISPDPKAMFPLRSVRYADDGRPYVDARTRKVDGTVVTRRRYGEIKACERCEQKFLSLNKRSLGYCSRGCAKRDVPNVKLMTPSGMKIRADKMFSVAVRSKMACERCGESEYRKLQCAHIVSRRYLATRWAWDNAFCLCAGCHYWGHADPLGWIDYVEKMHGPNHLADLKRRAQRIVKMDRASYMSLIDTMEDLMEDLGLKPARTQRELRGMRP